MRLKLNNSKSISFALLILTGAQYIGCSDKPAINNQAEKKTPQLFTPPDTSTIPHDEFGDMVRYGRELLLNTAYYIGPNGTKGKYLGNKMNCSNCHLKAGTVPYGLNFFSTHARYPQYRGRENKVMTLPERVNNCVERPHNGIPMPLDSKEMVAIVSYMRWLSANVAIGEHVPGDGAAELQYPARAADPKKGAEIYTKHCASCHGANGEGQFNGDSSTYIYPPLWGNFAFECGSSMHRVLKMARFVKANMPHLKASWDKPFLTDVEAIDVSAFVVDDRIHPRPKKEKAESYPNIRNKPIDYDMGPYADPFTEDEHKFGPYQPIINYHKAHNLPVVF
jgi:thiosulfate dehydrogenase